MKLGLDFDGVLCTIDIAMLRLIDTLPKEQRGMIEEWYYREQKPLLNPELLICNDDEYIIITSRFKKLRKITEEWLSKFCPNYKKLVMVDLGPAYGCNNSEVINWTKRQAELKAEIINKEKLDVYIDDNLECVQELRKLCPETKILQYGGRI